MKVREIKHGDVTVLELSGRRVTTFVSLEFFKDIWHAIQDSNQWLLVSEASALSS